MPLKALAVVDAGIGGLGTYQAIKARSNIPVLYFSDSGYEPYGVVPTPRLRGRLQQIFEFLYTRAPSGLRLPVTPPVVRSPMTPT